MKQSAWMSPAVGEVETDALRYVGVGVFGPRKAIGKVVGKYSLLK